MDIDRKNFLALMYKYIQINRHSEPDSNKVYFSSEVRARFKKYFDETKYKNYISESLYTPFGNVKVKRGMVLKKSGIELRQGTY